VTVNFLYHAVSKSIYFLATLTMVGEVMFMTIPLKLKVYHNDKQPVRPKRYK